MTKNPWKPCKGCGWETTYPDYCMGCYEERQNRAMSYGGYPYEDHLYGMDEQEDRWEQRYDNYLDQQMEAQYNAEVEEEYMASMRIAEENERTFRVMQMEDDNARYREGIILEPSNYNKIEQDIMPHNHSPHKHEPKTLDPAHELLHLPLGENDAQAATVGQYLGLLLSTLWLQADGFSGKRPFGNSDWQYPVYIAMVKAGVATGNVYIEDGDSEYLDISSDEIVAADEMILQAIRLAYDHGQ